MFKDVMVHRAYFEIFPGGNKVSEVLGITRKYLPGYTAIPYITGGKDKAVTGLIIEFVSASTEDGPLFSAMVQEINETIGQACAMETRVVGQTQCTCPA